MTSLVLGDLILESLTPSEGPIGPHESKGGNNQLHFGIKPLFQLVTSPREQ